MSLDPCARDDSSPHDTRPTVSTAAASARITSLGLVGDSPAMRRLHLDLARYAPRAATVVITGESGSGKELVARALHDLSSRVRAPFVAMNVATLRRELTASELFGHERGAFTGAVTPHKGLFEQASGGTLFLDEIGELDPAAQADLLRVLETREVRPLGSTRPRMVDVRVIAATHRDLNAMVTAGQFRADLYYRLHVLAIAVPSLRERVEDLPALVTHLLWRERHESGVRHVTRDALAVLATYHWPGGVRQLVNVLRRTLARTDTPALDADAIREALTVEPGTVAAVPYHVPVRRELPPSMVAETVARFGGNISQAARELGVARSTVRAHLRTRTSKPSPA